MSKKDYVTIAKAIKDSANDPDKLAYSIAKVLKADNPAFQFSKFLDACGVKIEA